MRYLTISGTAGGFFIFSASLMPAQKADSTVVQLCPADTTQKAEPAADGEKTHWLWRNASVTGGQITLPFKIRQSEENHTFRLTTDVTLGGYIGYTRKLSTKREFFVTVPLTAGLTFINLNDNNTAFKAESTDAEVVPGLTWSTGMILQLEQYSLGLMIGKDYAGDVGDQWQYHGKLWWSFGIGFVFLQ